MMLVVVVFYFVVVLHFAVAVLHFIASYVMLFFSLLFNVIPHTLPWTIAGFLHPFYTFSPAHRRVIRDTFIFNLSEIFFSQFYRERYGFDWALFTHRRFFYLIMLLYQLFTWVYQGLPGSQQFFLEVCRISY